MNDDMPDHDRLIDEAIDLMIRRQNAPENPVTAEIIRGWRSRSAHHERAWARVAKVHGASGDILDEKRNRERRSAFAVTRRSFLIGGLVVSGTAAYSLGPDLLVRRRADFITGKGEIRQVDLPDGSVATLGPQTALALDYGPDRRAVLLLEGMSFFDVAPDSGRVFSVVSRTVHATALGTAFEVSDDTDFLTVSVDHGLVSVRSSEPPLRTEEQLGGGQWITVDRASGRIDRGQREADQIAAWRNNLLFAEKEALAALVARIARWIPGRVIIADPMISRERVSGVFDLTNPVRALQAAVHPTGARVRQVSDLLTVVSPI
jgi:transmembrane sensor